MSIFNLDNQNESLDNKIVAGLERLSQVFRILLWDKAKEFSLSPIQIQLMIFILHHSKEKTTVSYLAQEFNFTKPTISDAVKVLEQKKLIKKNIDNVDSRSYTIQLTAAGRKIVADTETYADPLTSLIANSSKSDKLVLWQNISSLITQFNKSNIISVQRTCYNCQHFESKNKTNFCKLLNQKLEIQDIRIDCGEFEEVYS
jgi:DNA-binding MarR family transcriptional regulator